MRWPGLFYTDRMTTRATMNGHRTVELGVRTGHGYTETEFLTQLRGRRGLQMYREMCDNDDTVGEILFAIEMLIRQVDWPVEPAGNTPQDLEAAEFLESCVTDMSHSWPDFISTVLTMLPYGWACHEVVYKLRDGEQSRYADGRVGWAKLAYQPQEAKWEWVMGEHDIEAFRWAYDGGRGEIPWEKLLLFRTTTARGPDGRSVLRNAYRSWWFKKRLEEYAAIGAERDANGVLIAKIPAEMILDNDDFFTTAKELVTRYHRDEQAGFVWPLEYDDTGRPLYELDVIRSDGSSSLAAIRELIQMFAENIAGTVLADFVRLGRTQSGSRALAEPKQELFQKALEGWVTSIAEVLNRHAVPRLFALNNFNLERLPRFVPEEVQDVNLADLGDFIRNTSQAGMDWGFLTDGDPIVDQIRQKAGFDAAPELASTIET